GAPQGTNLPENVREAPASRPGGKKARKGIMRRGGLTSAATISVFKHPVLALLNRRMPRQRNDARTTMSIAAGTLLITQGARMEASGSHGLARKSKSNTVSQSVAGNHDPMMFEISAAATFTRNKHSLRCLFTHPRSSLARENATGPL